MSADNGNFAGTGGTWVQWQDLKEFGEALAVYPITERAPIGLACEFDQRVGDDLILQAELSPSDQRGNVRCRFEIADYNQPKIRVRAEFLTNYPDIQAFHLEIAMLVKGEIDEAVLNGRAP